MSPRIVPTLASSVVSELLLSGGQLWMRDHPHVKAIKVKHFWLLPWVKEQPWFYQPRKPGAEGPAPVEWGSSTPGLGQGSFAYEETEARPQVSPPSKLVQVVLGLRQDAHSQPPCQERPQV